RLDVDLGAAHVELVDDRAQVAVHRVRCGDDQAVGRGVGLDEAGTLAAAGTGRRGLALLAEGVAGAAHADTALLALLPAEVAPGTAGAAVVGGLDRAAGSALLLHRHR